MKELNGNYSSKERVNITLRGGAADRVPINYSANSAIDSKMKKYFGCKPDDYELFLKKLGVDFIGTAAPYTGKRLHPEVPGRNVNPLNGIRTMWIEHESGGYWDFCDFVLKDADLETIEKWPLPSPDDFNYNSVKTSAMSLSKDFAVYLGNPGLPDIINSNGMIRSMEQVLLDMALEEPAGMRLIQRRADIDIEVIARSLEAAKGYIDFVWMGEDLGTQRGPIISLEMYRKIIKPYHKKVIDLARSYNLPTMIHSCGSSSWVFEDLIEMSMSAVDTLQPEAVNMSPEYLKEKFGGRLAFHGCISTAGPLAYGTVEDVRQYCRKTLDIMMPGGGYCFAPTHAIQDNSPLENVLAMYETVWEHGWY